MSGMDDAIASGPVTHAVLADVATERATHDGRGWTDEHDDECGGWRHLAEQAGRYVLALSYRAHMKESYWEGEPQSMPRHTPRELLVKLAALAVAGVEAWDREAARGKAP